jgi:hypothetical protein
MNLTGNVLSVGIFEKENIIYIHADWDLFTG